MKGFKVVVTLPEGRRNHFVPGLSNNISKARSAVDQIGRLYRKQGLVISPVANYFDGERDLILPPKDHLAGFTPEQRYFVDGGSRESVQAVLTN